MSINYNIKTGRIVNELEVKETQSGKPKLQFRIAVEDREIKKDGKYEVDFFNCVAIGKIAEIINKYSTKGKKIALEGKEKSRQYQDKNGETRYYNYTFVKKVEILEFNNDNSNNETGNLENTNEIDLEEDFFTDGISDDDLPF